MEVILFRGSFVLEVQLYPRYSCTTVQFVPEVQLYLNVRRGERVKQTNRDGFPADEPRCEVCGQTAGEVGETPELVGFHRVCGDCLREYGRREGVVADYAEGYLLGRETDFYLRWWWDGDAYLTDGEKLEIIRRAFGERARLHPEEGARAVGDYLRETTQEWEAYLKTV